MPTVFRLVRRSLATEAFTGQGAAKYGGRWNSKSVPVVYASATLSLAALETLVHIDRTLPIEYVFFVIEVGEKLITELEKASLPKRWREFPATSQTQKLGDAWAASQVSPALRVPSVIIPTEFNYLLNPAHPKFPALKISKAQPLSFDPRLK